MSLSIYDGTNATSIDDLLLGYTKRLEQVEEGEGWDQPPLLLTVYTSMVDDGHGGVRASGMAWTEPVQIPGAVATLDTDKALLAIAALCQLDQIPIRRDNDAFPMALTMSMEAWRVEHGERRTEERHALCYAGPTGNIHHVWRVRGLEQQFETIERGTWSESCPGPVLHAFRVLGEVLVGSPVDDDEEYEERGAA